MTFLIQTGRDPEIAQAELTAVYPAVQLRAISRDGWQLAEGLDLPDAQAALDQLGMVIQIAEQITAVDMSDLESSIAQYLCGLTEITGKITFAINTLGFGDARINQTLLVGVKKKLKNNERSCRFVNRNFKNVDAGTWHKEGRPVTLIILQRGDECFVARLVAAQNVERWAQRDLGKPQRDMQVGMLPPKLALALTNLTRTDGQLAPVIWDPFCGLGTVPIEAKTLGADVWASDLSSEMVAATQANLQHFFPDERCHVWQQDATHPPLQKPNAQTAIATEGYLGPICGRPLDANRLSKMREAVEPIMIDFIKNITEQTQIKTLVMCLPSWKMHDGGTALCKKTIAFCDQFWQNAVAPETIWRRENQVVGRHILVLRRD